MTVLALVGFADSLFLTIEHFRGTIVPCTIVHGCQLVTTSRYATIGPVPIALFGAMFYIYTLVVLLISNSTNFFRRLFPIAAAGAFVFSLYLIFLQALVLHAYCLYCLISAGSSTSIFILTLFERKVRISSTPALTKPILTL